MDLSLLTLLEQDQVRFSTYILLNELTDTAQQYYIIYNTTGSSLNTRTKLLGFLRVMCQLAWNMYMHGTCSVVYCTIV